MVGITSCIVFYRLIGSVMIGGYAGDWELWYGIYEYREIGVSEREEENITRLGERRETSSIRVVTMGEVCSCWVQFMIIEWYTSFCIHLLLFSCLFVVFYQTSTKCSYHLLVYEKVKG